MKLVTTYFQPTSVLDSFKCRLSDTLKNEQLLRVYLNRIEVADIAPEGLQHRCSVTIRGKVLTAARLPVKGAAWSRVLVLTDHPDPELILLEYDDRLGRLTQVKGQSMYEQGPRPMEYLNTVVIDPAGKYAIVCCYAGKLKVIVFVGDDDEEEEDDEVFSEFDVVLPEMSVLSLAILEDSTVGILHIDFQQRLQLLSRSLSLSTQDLSSSPSELVPKTIIKPSSVSLPTTDLLPHLVPIPSTNVEQGGVMILGGRKILFFAYCSEEEQQRLASRRRRLDSKKSGKDAEGVAAAKKKEQERDDKRRKPTAWVSWPWGEVAAWGGTDVPTRFLVGDAFGKIAMISADISGEHGIILIPLGQTSSPTTITYLSSQILFLGSHVGPSLLLRLSTSPVDKSGTSFPPSKEHKVIQASSLGNQSASSKGKQRRMSTNETESDTDGRMGTLIETEGAYILSADSFKNIAPVSDAIIIDPEESGHKAVITCSGGRNTGSLHVLRNGADFKEVGSVAGVEGVTDVWAIRKGSEDEFHTHVVMSTLEQTHVFAIDKLDQFTHLPPPTGFDTSLPTLAMSARPLLRRIDNTYVIVQVTERALNLLTYNEEMQSFFLGMGKYDTWVPDGEGVRITAASVNGGQIVLGLSSKKLVVVYLHPSLGFWVLELAVQDQIASISCDLASPSNPNSAHCIAVSYWASNVVQLIQFVADGELPKMVVTDSVTLDAFPRSLLLHDFGQGQDDDEQLFIPYLLVGTSTGDVITYPFVKDYELCKLEKGKCSVSFGHAPVSLRTCVIGGGAGGSKSKSNSGSKETKTAVFAAGNRASLVFWGEGRLKTSPVLLKDVASTTSIDVPGQVGSKIMVVYTTGFSIGHIEALEKMHVHSTETGYENPRRIAHDSASRTLAVAFRQVRATKVAEFAEPPKSYLKLMEDVSLRSIDSATYEVGTHEEIVSLQNLSLTIRTGRETGEAANYYCAGTAFHDHEDSEPKKGRVLVFEVRYGDSAQRGTSLRLVAEGDVNGCVYALASINGLLAATVNSDVIIMQMAQDSATTEQKLFLEQEASRSHNYFATSLSVHKDRLILGDRISSVSVLRLSEQKGKARRTRDSMDVDGEDSASTQRVLKVVARDYSPLLPVCLTGIEDGGVIGADALMNLFSFRVVSDRGKSFLEKDACYYAADLITKIIKGAVVMNTEIPGAEQSRSSSTSKRNDSGSSESSCLSPSHVCFTPSGAISVIVDVKSETLAIRLTALERNLARVTKGVGSDSQAKFRKPRVRTFTKDKEEQPSYGFLDGDFLEEFLKITDEEQVRAILEGESEAEKVDMSGDAVRHVLGTLQGLH